MSEPDTAPGGLDGSTAGVIAPPPLIFAAFALAAHALEYWRAAPMFEPLARWSVAAVLFIVAGSIVVAAIVQFRRTGTNVRPDRPALALATTGIYAHTRNPMYLSLTLLYLALAAIDNNAWFLLLVWPLLGVMYWGVIAREERYLERRFGRPYVEYCRRVRRWL